MGIQQGSPTQGSAGNSPIKARSVSNKDGRKAAKIYPDRVSYVFSPSTRKDDRYSDLKSKY